VPQCLTGDIGFDIDGEARLRGRMPQLGTPNPHDGILFLVSPFASTTSEIDKTDTIVSITPEAHVKLLELRDAEAEGAQLGLRLEMLNSTSATTNDQK
jgi:hypothetical protein